MGNKALRGAAGGQEFLGPQSCAIFSEHQRPDKAARSMRDGHRTTGGQIRRVSREIGKTHNIGPLPP